MFTLLIIEDEPKVLTLLCKILESIKLENLQLVGTCSSIIEGKEQIEVKQPDIVISDIQLMGGLSFEMIEALPAFAPKLIFITGHESFALPAFKYDPITFLLKPIDPEALKDALEKAMLQIKLESGSKRRQISQKGRIIIRGFKGVHILELEKIVRFEADRNYTVVVMNSGNRIMVSKNLTQIQLMLEDVTFIRVHKSHLINLSCIRTIELTSRIFIILDNQERIPVSRNKKSELLELMGIREPMS